ncbi:PEP/pyruvate-binding domain-containing protein [Lentzea sp. BCCO 10_0856]|uniref:PEP/pyruvate-binding domain-containing protein n=1 Tax=Lentzea miocenica TaxID=3095431 RepID=A0ABU4SSJ8_9PSEU|nr:PEP/pyruvate-binding domain-containing protein [Lentzea sp. BCCO 10_0856]MDX8028825.1 PEP/pyruvate-binding domain-containing protein [Lentzea sp. BCCO 10_0856]
MIPLILPLDDPAADLATVGGKGASLARLTRAGLPVPAGFHLTTRAYRERSADGVLEAFRELGGPVAVRSSATAEDLPDLSFAGQHDTVLNVDESGLFDAVLKCWDSLRSERAVAYRERNGIESAEMAVVVQRMVPADVSGVLFTADPVTGRAEPVINAVRGLGEALVSGEADSAELLDDAQKSELIALGERIEALYGMPMDVEWALAGKRFWILQARPITSSRVEWNDSLDGDYLWSNGNVGEAIPEVMTPVTWSLVEVLSSVAIGPHRISGNIGGRFYLNISTYTALGTAIGRADEMRRSGEETFGRIPAGVTVPPLPMSRLAILGAVLRGAGGPIKQQILYRTRLPRLVRDNPGRCAAAHKAIAACTTPAALLGLWRRDLDQLLRFVCPVLDAGARMIAGGPAALRRRLVELAGEEDAATLLTGFHDGAGLASLGPLVGLARLRSGEIDRDTFAQSWGHRSANDFEIYAPRPAEDPDWISRQLETLADPEALLARQREARAGAWHRLVAKHPAAAQKIRKRLDRIGDGARAREQARSEMVRAFWVMRAFVLRAGELTSSGDDLFFLPIDDVLRVLDGETKLLDRVPAQRAAYERYRALPPYPAVIRGRFDPESWAASPNRRADLHDATADVPMPSDVTGFPGSAGVVEGVARVLARVEDGESLRQGEILVTTVTNIGWTPLFTRAAAVVTDVGAPLSHAAIVARELGIPAVVGCGNATTRIATGDRIQVDGARGTVKRVR